MTPEDGSETEIDQLVADAVGSIPSARFEQLLDGVIDGSLGADTGDGEPDGDEAEGDGRDRDVVPMVLVDGSGPGGPEVRATRARRWLAPLAAAAAVLAVLGLVGVSALVGGDAENSVDVAVGPDDPGGTQRPPVLLPGAQSAPGAAVTTDPSVPPSPYPPPPPPPYPDHPPLPPPMPAAPSPAPDPGVRPTVVFSGPTVVDACHREETWTVTVTNATSGTWRYSSGVTEAARSQQVSHVFLDWNNDYDYWIEYTAIGPGGETTVRHDVRVRVDQRVDYVRPDEECRSVAGAS